MSGDTTTTVAAAEISSTVATPTAASTSAYPATPTSPHITWSDSFSKAQSAINALFSIFPNSLPHTLSTSDTPSLALLNDPHISTHISALLRRPNSGAGDNNLCRWLYDTFQSSSSSLQLVVLRFIPLICGLYLSRVPLRKPLAGFEAILLAFYAHETTSRNGQAVTVNVPDLSHSSIYHETKQTAKNTSTELNLAVISPSLEPHGTVRSTKRLRIVAVALELYYAKISELPASSKLDFCEFCRIWAGQDGEMYKNGPDEPLESVAEEEEATEEGRINLSWEILQPVLRILGHCLMDAGERDEELREAASSACRSLYARSLHDINPRAILATASLLRLLKLAEEQKNDAVVDYTDIPKTHIINL